jgi:hypothetical protein
VKLKHVRAILRSPHQQQELKIRKAITKLVTAAGIGLLAATSMASAQSAFDPKQFFDDLQKQGAQMPNGFDPKKFFDDLQKQSAQSNQLEPRQFFEDLQKQGSKVPPMIKLK